MLVCHTYIRTSTVNRNNLSDVTEHGGLKLDCLKCFLVPTLFQVVDHMGLLHLGILMLTTLLSKHGTQAWSSIAYLDATCFGIQLTFPSM